MLFHIVLIYWIIFPSQHNVDTLLDKALISSTTKFRKKNFSFLLSSPRTLSLHVVLLADVEAVFINSTWNSKWTTSGRKLLLLNNCGFWWKKLLIKYLHLLFTPHSLIHLNCYESNLIMTANDTSQKYFVCLFLPHRNIQILLCHFKVKLMI